MLTYIIGDHLLAPGGMKGAADGGGTTVFLYVDGR